jgi:uncharacterized membrane protein
VDDILGQATLREVIDLLVRLVETAGAVVVVVGALIGFIRFLAVAVTIRSAGAFVPVRLDLARFLALGLEFQLAGDILRTAVAPTFAEIGQLAAIAAIRTALNYFLGREIREERAELDRARASPPAAEPDDAHLR